MSGMIHRYPTEVGSVAETTTNQEHVLAVNVAATEPINILRRDPTVRLSVITERGFEHLYHGIDRLAVVDDIEDLKQVRDTALDISGTHGAVDAVIAASERALPTGGYLRSYFGVPGLPFDVANLFCNKYAMKLRLREHGIPVAASVLAPDLGKLGHAVRQIGLPAVIKPAFGNGAAFTRVLIDERELAGTMAEDLRHELADAPRPLVVEEYVDMVDEYHCDAVVTHGTVTFSAVSRYFQPVLRSFGSLFGSHTVPDGSPEAAAVRALNQRVVRALGLTEGVTHLEVFRTAAHGYLVGEIACRPGGGGVPAMLRYKFGIDIHDLWLSCSLGRRVVPEVRPADGVFLWCILPVRHGTVAAVSTADDFRDIPEVLDVDITVTPGDRITGVLRSTSMAGILLCRTDSVTAVPRLLAEIESRFVIDIQER